MKEHSLYPPAPSPIDGLLFDQIIDGRVPVKFTVVVALLPLQTTISAGSVTVGVGFTVMVNETVSPVQLFATRCDCNCSQ